MRKHYTWQAHAKSYVEQVRALIDQPRREPVAWPDDRAAHYRDRAIFTDIDQTLLGDREALAEFNETIRRIHRKVAFGIVSGRRIDSTLAILKKNGVPAPDVLISGLGTRIHYGPNLTEDKHWLNHIDHDWNRARLRRVLDEIPGLEIQEKSRQTAFKLSYYYDSAKAPAHDEIMAELHKNELNANVIISFGQFLDVVPARASKGLALRYAALRLDIPLENILVAGGSGADEDMIRGNAQAVVVGNRHEEELSSLVDLERVYFSDRPYAGGLLDAIEHYNFLRDGEGRPG